MAVKVIRKRACALAAVPTCAEAESLVAMVGSLPVQHLERKKH